MQETSLKKVTYHHFAYGEHVWRFHESQVAETEGQQFVVLSPTDRGFCRFIAAHLPKSEQPANPSLVSVSGFQDILRLRNEAQALHLNPAQALFAKAKARPAKRSRQQVEEDRRAPSSMEVTLPSVDSLPESKVIMLRPIRALDRLYIRLEP